VVPKINKDELMIDICNYISSTDDKDGDETTELVKYILNNYIEYIIWIPLYVHKAINQNIQEMSQ
jgi:hypothetical protein